MEPNRQPRGVPWVQLRRFFADRRPVSIRKAAELLGCDPAWVSAHLDEVAAPHPERGIPWVEFAALARESLTPAELDAAVGATPSFPELLRVAPVAWRLPSYLLIALEHLVAEERALDPLASRLTVEAYVARRLDLMLEPATIDRLCIEPVFRAAFHFPDDDE